uniref:inactive ubiquitin carboxyl-terminal hydrolase 54 isoform X2 n=1 Tax=Ciona intestinalis TaxID=7719 RepID=UPI000EF4A4E9|nr:inactive ubiquitin carboxyl-terminal hydrolase 54 isoform X2 [Ciona intestinalis]|eukprot:XP_026693915.1 inactive ubiquitin carboxyl-terminal hydrolase 54 isoform X2 [Ciona intestinalis]
MFKKNRNRFVSTSSVVTNKGLLNKPGDNNCFLNSAIQVLWHLDSFRKNFRQLTGHACMGASCIFCALKHIFQQFQYSKDEALPPTLLRSALAEAFHEQSRFQLGLMDDAAECFENILMRIHVHIGNTMREDVCTAPHCIPHQKFGMSLVEQCVCSCGATSEPLPFIEMVHYVSASALRIEDEVMRARYGTSDQKFGRIIRVAGSSGNLRSCPSNCGSRVEMRKVLMNCPDVVSIGVGWDSEEPQVGDIVSLVHALGTTIKLTDLFHTVVDERALRTELYLVGMVCYYGKHYSTFFFHTKLRKWVYFDDAQVSEVGKRWSNVISKCIKGHHQPLLLLYSNPHASPISISSAPTVTTMIDGSEKAKQEPTKPAAKVTTEKPHPIKNNPQKPPQKHSPIKQDPPNPTPVANKVAKKPIFQWKMTPDVGHYIEPNHAQWTKHKPYPAQHKKTKPTIYLDDITIEDGSIRGEERSNTNERQPVDNSSMKDDDVIITDDVIRRDDVTSDDDDDVINNDDDVMNEDVISDDVISDDVISDDVISEEIKHYNLTDDITNKLNDKCRSLLRDADELMEQSNAADKLMDYPSALQMCLEATKVLESVMLLEGVTPQYLMSARVKHGHAVNKGHILQRRKQLRSSVTGGRQSMTEADRDMTSSGEDLINLDEHGITRFQHHVSIMII